MTAPIPLRLDPADYPPPHGPDSCLCDACHRLRREQGHRPLTLRETLSSLTLADREAFALSGDEWRRRAGEERDKGNATTADTFRVVARIADAVARGRTP